MNAEPPASPLLLPELGAASLLRALFKRPRRGQGAPTPRTVFRLEAIDDAHLRRYRDALGFAGAHVPLTWWYLPAQRAQVATLLAPAFPFRLAGAVHVANALEMLGDPVPGQPLLLATRVAIRPPADNGAVHADLETTATQDGVALFVCRSTYLVVRGRRRKSGRPALPLPALPTVGAWTVGHASGRRYAALSGDWNPIHLWRWSARLMGMPRPIIHGMHTLARACAELERAAGRPVVFLDACFRSPVALGSDVALGADFHAGEFAAIAGDRVAAEGRFRFGPVANTCTPDTDQRIHQA